MEKDNMSMIKRMYHNAYLFLPDEYHHDSVLDYINMRREMVRKSDLSLLPSAEDLNEKSSNYEFFVTFMGIIRLLCELEDNSHSKGEIMQRIIEEYDLNELFFMYAKAIDHYLGTLPKPIN